MRHILLVMLLAAGLTPRLWADEFVVDPVHSSLGFDVRYLVSTLEGRFNRFDGVVSYDPENPESLEVEFVVAADSIDTASQKRDTHLRSKDFFDVETYPKITFRSTSVTRFDERQLAVAGDLSLHGVTRPITALVTVSGPTPPDEKGQMTIGCRATFSVLRSDFGVNTWKDAHGAVGDEVKIRLLVAAHAQSPK
ncbi:MAG: YceI family protein [Candidatus Eremiobacteraeota bacterium]|nr:YceI family protein [Candidatus Eremiobacteraeota bacterium]